MKLQCLAGQGDRRSTIPGKSIPARGQERVAACGGV